MFILFCLYAYVRIFHDAVIITVISIIAAASISLYYTTKNRKNRENISIQKANIKHNYNQLAAEYDKLNSSHNELKLKYEELKSDQVELVRSKKGCKAFLIIRRRLYGNTMLLKKNGIFQTVFLKYIILIGYGPRVRQTYYLKN